MECKRALDEGGSIPKAEKLLKQWGLATAEKKAGREASQGVIDSYVHAGGRIGAHGRAELRDRLRRAHRRLQDPRARDRDAGRGDQPDAHRLARRRSRPADGDVPLLDQPYIRDPSKTVQDLVNEGIAKLRENIVVRRIRPIRAWQQLSLWMDACAIAGSSSS